MICHASLSKHDCMYIKIQNRHGKNDYSWYKYKPSPKRAHALTKAISSAAATGSAELGSLANIVPVASRYA